MGDGQSEEALEPYRERVLYSIHVGEEGEGSQVQLVVLCRSIVVFTA